MAHPPIEARKTYADLLRQNGRAAAIKSFIICSCWYLFNQFFLHETLNTFILAVGFLFFACYETWKSKLVQFLRRIL